MHPTLPTWLFLVAALLSSIGHIHGFANSIVFVDPVNGTDVAACATDNTTSCQTIEFAVLIAQQNNVSIVKLHPGIYNISTTISVSAPSLTIASISGTNVTIIKMYPPVATSGFGVSGSQNMAHFVLQNISFICDEEVFGGPVVRFAPRTAIRPFLLIEGCSFTNVSTRLDTTITVNTAPLGPEQVESATVIVRDCSFTNIRSQSSRGSAIKISSSRMYNATIILDSNTFHKCSSMASSGGAIGISSVAFISSNIFLNSLTSVDSSSTMEGGFLNFQVWGELLDTNLTLLNLNISRSTSNSSAVVLIAASFVNRSQILLQGNLFSDTRAWQIGSGVTITYGTMDSASTLRVLSSEFRHCTAPQASALTLSGGGSTTSGLIQVKGCVFISTTAVAGSAIWFQQVGALRSLRFIVEDSKFIDCTCQLGGIVSIGANLAASSSIEIVTSSFTDIHVKPIGSPITVAISAMNQSSVLLESLQITNCSGLAGAAFLTFSSSLTLSSIILRDVKIASCSSIATGGCLTVIANQAVSTSFHVITSSFIQTTGANEDSRSIYLQTTGRVESTTISINQTTFGNASSQGLGGAVAMDMSGSTVKKLVVSINGSTFHGCSSTGDGGSLSMLFNNITESELAIRKSLFQFGFSESAGTVFIEVQGFSEEIDLTSDNNQFINNSAAGGAGLYVSLKDSVDYFLLGVFKTTFQSCTSKGNTSGGCIAVHAPERLTNFWFSVESSLFALCSSSGGLGGGAIAISAHGNALLERSYMGFNDTIFSTCTTTGKGGAVLLSGFEVIDELSFLSSFSTFIDNKAQIGAAIAIESNSIKLFDFEVLDTKVIRNGAVEAAGVSLETQFLQRSVFKFQRSQFLGAISDDGSVFELVATQSYAGTEITFEQVLFSQITHAHSVPGPPLSLILLSLNNLKDECFFRFSDVTLNSVLTQTGIVSFEVPSVLVVPQPIQVEQLVLQNSESHFVSTLPKDQWLIDYSCFEGFVYSPSTGCQEIASGVSSGSKSRLQIVAIIASVVTTAVAAVFLIVVLFILRNRQRIRWQLYTPDFEMKPLAKKDDLPIDELADLEVHRENITIFREIGSGNFSHVMEASVVGLPGDQGLPVTVAAKFSTEQILQNDRSMLFAEAKQMRRFNHANVVRLLAVCFQSSPCCILLELMPNGDLKTYLRAYASRLKQGAGSSATITPQHLIQLACDCSSGFEYLSSIKYIHRDIAARNVVLSDTFTAKIGDFGLSRALQSSEYYRSNTQRHWVLPIRWMAPESFLDGAWNLKTDVWMFGVLLWEIFSFAETPWTDVPDASVMPLIQQLKKLPKPDLCPSPVYDVMLDCWRIDPASRATAGGIRQQIHSYHAKHHGTLLSDGNTNHSDKVPSASLLWPRLADLVASERTSKDAALDTEGMSLDVKSEQARSAFSALETPRSNITITGQLGSGTFGDVKRAILSSKYEVAVKCLKSSSDGDSRDKFLAEARILAVLKHAHIVRLVGVCTCEAPYWMVIELMPLGELLGYLREHSPAKASASTVFSQANMVSTVLQIADAMEFLESKHIIHRDLAARNILVATENPVGVKLSDVGLARTLKSSAYYRKTSDDKVPVKWMAPESITDRKYSSKSDVWSFAVFAWEAFSYGARPYADMSTHAFVNAVLRGYRMPRPDACPPDIYDLMLRCWQREPEKRPSFADIHAHLAQLSEA